MINRCYIILSHIDIERGIRGEHTAVKLLKFRSRFNPAFLR